MKKGLWMGLMSMGLVIPMALGLAACGENSNGGDNKSYNITVWVGEGTDTLTKNQIKEFNKTNEWGVTFNATVEIVSESVAMGNAISTPQSCADIFCFAQDQLARGKYAARLQTLNASSVTAITENCDAASVAAATMGKTVCAFPMTADNGYFMYYDKSVITDESHVDSLEALIADCEAAGRYFAMNLTEDGGAWYAASFFYATGCQSEWTTDEKGIFTKFDDTFNSDNGVIALQGMQKLMKSKAYLSSAEISEFTMATPAAVVVSGIWGYKAAKQALGNRLGIAPLPKFTVNEEEYQLKSYLGCKLMGVKPQTDSYKALYLQKLAMYLTSKDCQLERFNEVGWGPTDKAAQQDPDVLAAPALSVLANSSTVLQGQYPTNWWTEVQRMTGSVKGSTQEESSLRTALAEYNKTLSGLLGASN